MSAQNNPVMKSNLHGEFSKLLVVDEPCTKAGQESLVLVRISFMKIEGDDTSKERIPHKFNLFIVRCTERHTSVGHGGHDHRFFSWCRHMFHIRTVDTGLAKQIPSLGLFRNPIGTENT
jgi:hypothetical protein